MKNFTRGKNGKLYHGKGTQGGLAPLPPTLSGSKSLLPIPPALLAGLSPIAAALPNFDNFIEPTVGGHAMSSLVKAGLTGREIEDIATRPSKANLPKVSWGSVALAEADNAGYENIAKLAGGKYLVGAAYDNLVSNYDLDNHAKTEAESRIRAHANTVPIQKLLSAMKHSAAANAYSKSDIGKIDHLLEGYSSPDYINARAFDIDEDSKDRKLVYSRDMVRILNLAKVSYLAEQEEPSSYHELAEDKARSQRNYLRETTSANASGGGYPKFKDAPSERLIEARVSVKLVEKELAREAKQPGSRLDLFARKQKKADELNNKLAHAREGLELLENRKA